MVLPGAKADAFRRAAIHAAFLMGRDPRKTGFFAFVQFRQLPLQWALPTRFETIPSRPIAHALANTPALPRPQSVSERGLLAAGRRALKPMCGPVLPCGRL